MLVIGDPALHLLDLAPVEPRQLALAAGGIDALDLLQREALALEPLDVGDALDIRQFKDAIAVAVFT